MLNFQCLVQCQNTYTPLKTIQNYFFPCLCETFRIKHGVHSPKYNHINNRIRKYHSFQKFRVGVTGITTPGQKKVARRFHWSRKMTSLKVDVLDEARFRLGYPNWQNMFKNNFLGVSVNTGPEDITNLLLSFVEHYFQETDMETESLIVLLVASMADKLGKLKHRHHHHHHHHHHRHHQHHHSSFSQTYDDFKPVTNPGHISLANSLTMMRILLLVQQIASSVEPGIDNLDVNQDGVNTCDNDVTVRHGRAAPCSKLDKVRILLSDLFIAAIFKEAAVSGNALILQYSFKAMNKTIEGIFHASSIDIKEATTVSMKIDYNDVIVRDNPPTKIKLPLQSARTLGTNVEKGKRIGSGGYVTTPVNMFSTLQKEQLEYENETVHNFQENCSSAARKLSKNKNSKEEAVNMTEQNNRTCNSVTRNEKSEFVNTKPNNTLESSTFMERPDHPQALYGWGWTQELGVICQGCAALSGLGGDVQQAVFDFGRAIPLIRQMKWNGDLDLDLQDKYLTRLESYLGDFPDCANKRLLVSLCRNYVLQSNE